MNSAGGTERRLLLIRHGQSEWNAVRRWQGTANPPLTSLGREQARAVGRELATQVADGGLTIGSMWTSDLVRADTTARLIAGELGIDHIQQEPLLREAAAGEWEGLTPDDIEARWPGWLAAHRRPPGFEPYDSVVNRVARGLQHIAATANAASDGEVEDGEDLEDGELEDGEDVAATSLVIAHSGVIRSFVRWLGFTDERVPNLGGFWMRVDPDGPIAPSSFAVDQPFDPAASTQGRLRSTGVDAPGEEPVPEP